MKSETKSLFTFTVRDIVEIAAFVSIAIILDTFLKVPINAAGGSINIAMLPLFLIALDKGWFKGFLAGGIIYALITCLLDGYGFVSFPLDYLLGFGSVCVLGLFRPLIKIEDNKVKVKSYLFLSLGITIAYFLRFTFSTISGIVIYELDLVSSMIYQITYIGPSYGVVLVLMNLILKPFLKLFQKQSA